ncbi:MAG: HD domain-containing protein [Oligoflexia bacterium]|nr:MAG: HD domain-containing protein [Oligoflexia bacterium]
MEIRDPVHGTIEISDAETIVIDTPEYQRLRQIKQLGFAEYSFPGATHNRYLHSIGVTHIAGQAFDQAFKEFKFSKSSVKERLRQTLRLAALLHDVGHGPLSHTTEEVMPPLKQLKVDIYKHRKNFKLTNDLRANHEDYTIKYLTDSDLSDVLKKTFSDISPLHVACLIDKTLQVSDDFFHDQGVDFRPILSQLVSSELDCDRMDYLERDSHFCGTNYGKFDLPWLVSNLIPYEHKGKLYLALNRRALYTFDDFLISRHHMHLMVYFHHKSIIYEEMLNKYLTSEDCTFFLPSDIHEYTSYTDYKLYEHLSQQKNPWAQRLALRKPYKVLIELHNTEESLRPAAIEKALQREGIDVIWSSSKARLSKYHATSAEDRSSQIFVVDQYDRLDRPAPIDKSTEIFNRYEGARIIDRLYVAPEDYKKAEKILISKKL